jgi:hypothetical protein
MLTELARTASEDVIATEPTSEQWHAFDLIGGSISLALK